MTRLLRFLALCTLSGFFIMLGGQSAHANGENWSISKYDATIQLSADGAAHVTVTMDFDFGSDPGHGPEITLPTRQATKDPGQWLNLGVTFGGVTSPTGADVTPYIQRSEDGIGLRLGREGRTFTGVQTYVITYDLTGLVASKHAESGLDEFNWNLIGPLWKVPISNVTATVTGPGAPSRVACFWGPFDAQQPCDAASTSSTATFAVQRLSPGSPMQIVAAYPAGTFTGVTQTFSKRMYIGNMFPLTPWTGLGTAALTVGGWLLVRQRAKRHARDDEYLGMTPGLAPVAGQQAAVGERNGKTPIAVQFQPPKGARPGELGTLIDATADNVDVTATIIDLAVRGYIRIIPSDDGEHTFQALKGPEGLVGYEVSLLQTMFQSANVVTMEELKDKEYASLLPDARAELYDRVVELKWFKANPNHVRMMIFGGAFVLALLGVGVGFLGAFVGWGLLGLSGIIVGALLALSAGKFTARTADGSAMLAQTKGFELYLSTAEANQIKFEEGTDVFSRYLPYAIIFGVADRWVKVFKELEQAGMYTPDVSWYGGMNFYMFNAWSFSNAMDNLSSSMSSAMSSAISSATAASSGGSGFSGGGGFGGGGGGGW